MTGTDQSTDPGDPDRVDGTAPEDRLDAVEDRLTALEEHLAAVEDRLEEQEAAVQALRGYVGSVRAVNREVENRADAALAAARSLERRIDGDGGPNDGNDRRIDGDGDAAGPSPVVAGDDPSTRDGLSTRDGPPSHDGSPDREWTAGTAGGTGDETTRTKVYSRDPGATDGGAEGADEGSGVAWQTIASPGSGTGGDPRDGDPEATAGFSPDDWPGNGRESDPDRGESDPGERENDAPRSSGDRTDDRRGPVAGDPPREEAPPRDSSARSTTASTRGASAGGGHPSDGDDGGWRWPPDGDADVERAAPWGVPDPVPPAESDGEDDGGLLARLKRAL